MSLVLEMHGVGKLGHVVSPRAQPHSGKRDYGSMMKGSLYALGVCVFLLACSGAAKADTISYSIDQSGCSASCGSGPFGTVTLTDDGKGNVNVTAVLDPGYYFINTGSGNANSLDFELNPKTPGTIVNLDPSLFSNGGADAKSPFGSFNNSITCTGCPNGASGVPKTDAESLSFTVDGVDVQDFVANSDGYYFASDVADYNGKKVVATGSVGSDGPNAPVAPEPTSLLLLGTGMIALATTLKFKPVL